MFRMLLVAACLFGCNPKEPSPLSQWMEPNGKVKVLSMTGMIHDLVKEVGGERIDAVTLIMGEMDPHSYELVKGDAEKFEYAGVVFANGLGLEHGSSLAYQLKEHANVVTLADGLDAGDVIEVEGQLDPHIWMDISLWAKGVPLIVEALSKSAPEFASEFAERGEALHEELLKQDRESLEKMASLPEERRFLVTSHDAFHYFARRYLSGEGRVVAPEGLAPDGQMRFADIRRIVNAVKEHGVRVVFPESNVSQDSLTKVVAVCQDEGMDVRFAEGHLLGDSMGEAKGYLEMMGHNVRTLYEHLKD